VQLDCASSTGSTAHRDRGIRPAGANWRGPARLSLLPPRAAGAYYLPVNYETDCKGHADHGPAGDGRPVRRRRVRRAAPAASDRLREVLSGD